MKENERIMQAYIDLVIEKKTYNITVTKICKKLAIARKTFYYYFKDRFDLLEAIFVKYNIMPLKLSLELGVPIERCIYNWYNSFYEHKDFYIYVIQEDTKNSLVDLILQYMPKLGEKHYQKYIVDKKELDYIAYKFAVSQAMLLKKWIQEGMVESAEFMTKIYLYHYGNTIE